MCSRLQSRAFDFTSMILLQSKFDGIFILYPLNSTELIVTKLCARHDFFFFFWGGGGGGGGGVVECEQ